jgi:RNA polymerase sigma factor (sigma-70 family)
MTGALRLRLVRWFARRIPQCHAEDLAQLTLLRWWQADRRKVRDQEDFLFQVAKFELIDYFRDQQQPRAKAHTVDIDDVQIPTNDVAEVIGARQELAIVMRQIHKMPRKRRRVVLLRKVYGYSQKEISARLGISENTVEQHLQHGVLDFSVLDPATVQAADAAAAADRRRTSRTRPQAADVA